MFGGGGLLAYSQGNAVVIYDTAAGRRTGRFTIGESDDISSGVTALAYSAARRTLVVANSNGLTFWNPATRKRVGQIPLKLRGQLGVAVSADGRTLVAGDDISGLEFFNDLLWSTPAQLRASVCEVLGGGLTAADWRSYAGGIRRHRLTCP